MEPGSYPEKKDSNTFVWESETDSKHLLNTAAIYGANASGKSNLLDALSTMRSIVLNSSVWQLDKKLPYTPYKLSTETLHAPTEYEVEFIAGGVRYLYGFSFNAARIVSEYLFAYPKKKPQKWFLRAWDGEGYKWEFGRSFSGEKQAWVNSTKENSLFLSTAVQLNSGQLKDVYNWFASGIAIASVDGWHSRFTSMQCSEPEQKRKIIQFLRDADIYVDDIHVEEEEFDVDKLPDLIPSSLRERMAEQFEGETLYETQFVRNDDEGKPVLFDESEESDGTNRFFSFAGPWLDALSAGKTLFVDELNSNLHPMLVKYMVSLFHCKKSNPNNAQLVFTTHETSILNQSVFRRDQVWFMQKDKYKSELYSLSEFKVRKDYENLEERYLSGSYGALPFIFWEDC
jgi:AAA15 family ATPase/GTPase